MPRASGSSYMGPTVLTDRPATTGFFSLRPFPPALAEPIRIDGSHGEGGGQILRTTSALSVLTGIPVHVTNIRAKRTQPGLRPQHVTSLRAVAELSNAALVGCEPGSNEIVLRPGEPTAGDHRFDIGTAGSISLLLQAVLPVLLLTPGRSTLEVRGGTDVAYAPPIDWVREVYLPWIAPVAGHVSFEVERRGFYPKGGGRVTLQVDNPADQPHPGSPEALARIRDHVEATLGTARWKQDWLSGVRIYSVAESRLAQSRVAERQAQAAEIIFAMEGFEPIGSTVRYEEAASMGSTLTAILEDEAGNRVAGDMLGARGLMAEDVGRDAATAAVVDWRGSATVDRHLADHLVPWVALGAGMVRVPEPTEHLKTNLFVTRQMLGRRAVTLERDVLCHGKLR